MKTRTKSSAKAIESIDNSNITTAKVQLGPESIHPAQLFILPKDASPEARIVSLANPRILTKTRYFVCPQLGFYEFTRVAAPKTTPRSWLLVQQELDSSATSTLKDQGALEPQLNRQDAYYSKGYVMRNAELFIATPVDPLFLILPALTPPISKNSEPIKTLFLSGDDYLDRISSVSSHFESLIRSDSIRAKLEGRMAAVCDTVEAGDETMYRLNEEKLLGEILQKARKMVDRGLPASMEEKLVRKALEIPMLNIRREDSSLHELANERDLVRENSELLTSATDTQDTQTSSSSSETAANSFSEASTAATSFSDHYKNLSSPKMSTMLPQAISAPEGVSHLLRLRTAIFFICSNYLAPNLSEIIKNVLASPRSTVDFGSLDKHLAHVTKLKQDALVARSIGDFSRKRSLNEDGESRAQTKRKKEEEEKRRKAGESRGVRDLKKVDVSGMKKMSHFFKKK